MQAKKQRPILAILVVVLMMTYSCLPSNPFELSRKQVKKLTKRAEQGDADAARCLKFHYSNSRDSEQSMYWLRKSAEYNNLDSREELYGYSILSDDPEVYEEAIRHLREATMQNHSSAQTELASLYYKGEKLDKDLDLAEMWAKKAANNGDVFAMELMSIILPDKNPDRLSLIEAYKWTIIGLTRTKPTSYIARSFRKQQQTIIEIADVIRFETDEIKQEAAELADSAIDSIPVKLGPLEKINKFVNEECRSVK